MADIDIKRLRTTELKNLSFKDSLDVISQIEEAILLDFDAVNTTEEFGEYFSYVNIISARLNGDEFKKITKTQRSSLKTRLDNLRFNLSVLMRVNNLAEEQWRENRQKFSNFFTSVGRELDATRDQIITRVDKEKKEVLAVVEKEKEEINKVEHTTLTHVLSLMGIFSAIITIIMSVVLTSTSWLNNSEGPSALLAFLIPNLVSLFAVVVLLSFIYLYTHSNASNDPSINNKPNRVVVSYVAISVVLLIAVLLTTIILANIFKTNKPHYQYIISSSEYKVVEKHIEGGERVQYFVFELDKIKYEFKYDEAYLHGENLYFCPEHDTLE